jgi:hypothetical protein
MAKRHMRTGDLVEGQQVNVSLRDGTRLDDCQLVSSGGNRGRNLWLFTNGDDVFVALSEVVEVWETEASRPRAA